MLGGLWKEGLAWPRMAWLDIWHMNSDHHLECYRLAETGIVSSSDRLQGTTIVYDL